MPKPNETPIEEWSNGWLALETASLLDKPEFVIMHDDERRKAKLPSSRQEMIDFIKAKRNA